jgi:hypothetical protein
MAYLAVDKKGKYHLSLSKPVKIHGSLIQASFSTVIKIYNVKDLINRSLTWDDEPVEI